MEFNTIEINQIESLAKIQGIIDGLEKIDPSLDVQIDTRARIKMFLLNEELNELCIGNTFVKWDDNLYYTSEKLRIFLNGLPLKKINVIEE